MKQEYKFEIVIPDHQGARVKKYVITKSPTTQKLVWEHNYSSESLEAHIIRYIATQFNK